MHSKTVLLQEMSWPDVRELAAAKPIVIIPTGSIEQHGPHLPLEVDSCIAKALAEASAVRLCEKLPVAVTPVLDLGFSGEHMSFPGTLSLSAKTFMRIVHEVLLDLIRHGFDRFFLLNGHGGNEEALRLVARTLREEHEVIIATASYWQLAREEIQAVRQSPGGGMNHGGEEETSLMLFLRPELVRMEVAQANPLRWRSAYLSGGYERDAAVAYGRKRADIAPLGHNGDPTLATREKGKLLFEGIVEAIVRFGRDFYTWRLDAMSQERH
ncbi:MAG TPA: creatininase family protein [Terriglobales bacterium]|nr:creatininase family protein [Terriglobales bacterium]